jgi:hypothetical protein
MSHRLLLPIALGAVLADPVPLYSASGPRGCVSGEVDRVLQSYRESSRQQREFFDRLYQTMMEQKKEDLRAALNSERAELRFMAAYVAGERRMPWHQDFIQLLTDPTDAVRQSARRSLIILSFLALNPDEASLFEAAGKNTPPASSEPDLSPVDFGPLSPATPAAQKKAVAQWTEWFAEKRPLAGRSAGHPRVPSEFEDDRETNHLAAALLAATPERKAELAVLYRDAEGSGYTEALAVAIAQSSLQDRDAFREALASRLTRVTEETLKRQLDDRLSEVRRAAVLELVRRQNKSSFERMTALLLDPEPAVQRAARTALCQLSGQDFGPKQDATDSERALAVSQWREWWKKQPR